MSWWLSQSVQSELNSQACDKRNRTSLDQLINRLSQSYGVETVRKALNGGNPTSIFPGRFLEATPVHVAASL